MSERRCAEGSLEMAFKRVTLSWGGRMRDASQSKDFVVNVFSPISRHSAGLRGKEGNNE